MSMEISSEITRQQLHIFNKPKLAFTKIKVWILTAVFSRLYYFFNTRNNSNISLKIPKVRKHKSE